MRYELSLDALKLTGFSRSNEIPRTKKYSNTGITNLQYNIRRLCGEEKGNVTVLINTNNLIV
jgi:hypothetical protein